MKKTFTLFSLIALAITISAFSFFSFPGCIEGNEDVALENRVLEPFTEVEFNLPGNLTIEQVGTDDPRTIEIETNANLMKYITTEIKGGVLIISSEKCVTTNDKFNFSVKLNGISDLKINGSGDVKSNGKIKSDKLNISIYGSGDVKFKVEALSLNAAIKGSGDINLDGETKDLNLDIMGSGDVNASGLEASTGNVSVKGSGDCNINIINDLDVSVMGSGDVNYSGSPQVKKEIYGSGDVNQK